MSAKSIFAKVKHPTGLRANLFEGNIIERPLSKSFPCVFQCKCVSMLPDFFYTKMN